jgi:predicted DNA-binding transcriptional regulator AlpA
MDSQPTFLSGKRVDTRYGISPMTRWRWQRNEKLGFPMPMDINGRKLWRLSDLEAWERSRMAVGCDELGPGGQHGPSGELPSSRLRSSGNKRNRMHLKSVGNTTS